MQVKVNGAKWATRASAAAGDYANGTQTPKRSWSEATSASKANYEAGIAAANSRDAFAKGVQSAGDQAWRSGIENKGRARFSQGVAIAQNKYESGFRPFASAIESAQLPPRGPKGTNYGRVQAVGEALRNAKLNR